MMKIKWILAGILFLLFTVVGPAFAGFSSIVSFGDSLSDNGSDDGVGFGRATDGDQVWAEILASGYPAGLMDYAFCGATTGLGNPCLEEYNYPENTTGLTAQVGIFNSSIQELGNILDLTNPLFTVWAGANNFLSETSSPSQAVNDVINVLETLAGFGLGPENFLVLNLPNIAMTPEYYDADDGFANWAAERWVMEFNAGLEVALADFKVGNVYYLDVEKLFSAYGPDIDEDEWRDLFWNHDKFHPPAMGHQKIADAALALLGEKPTYPATVPVPSAVIPLISGLVGLTGLRRRRIA